MSASVRRAVTLLDNLTTQPSLAQFSFINGTDAVGDIVIVGVSQATGANTCATPTGWTKLAGPDDNAAGNLRTYVFAYKAVATDVDASPTTHDFQWTGGSRYTATAQVIQGSTASVSDILVASVAKSTSASLTTNTVTVTAGDWLISYQIFTRLNSTSTPDITPPANHTEGAESNTTNASAPNFAGSTNRKNTNVTSAGSAGGATFTATAGVTHMQGYALAVPTSVNVAPTCSAGSDLRKNPGASVSITATDSDSDGTISTRAWTQVSGTTVTLSGASTATVSYTQPASGTVVLRYTVTDNGGLTAQDDVSIVTNVAPTCGAGSDQTNKAGGATVTLSGTDSDSDGSIASRAWTQTAGTTVSLSGASTATATFTVPSVAEDETLTFRYTVTDNEGLTAFDDINVGILKTDDGGIRWYLVKSDHTTVEMDVWIVNSSGVKVRLANN